MVSYVGLSLIGYAVVVAFAYLYLRGGRDGESL